MNLDWVLNAKCRHLPIEAFDTDDPTPAQLLCAGCPVIGQCSRLALEPINAADLIERVCGTRPADGDDWVGVSGVKMGGVAL